MIGFHIVTSIELVEVEWDFGDGRVSNQIARVIKRIILKSFSKEGSYNVRLKALVEVENKDYVNDKSQDKLGFITSFMLEYKSLINFLTLKSLLALFTL